MFGKGAGHSVRCQPSGRQRLCALLIGLDAAGRAASMSQRIHGGSCSRG